LAVAHRCFGRDVTISIANVFHWL